MLSVFVLAVFVKYSSFSSFPHVFIMLSFLFYSACFAMYDGKIGPVLLNDNNFDDIVLKSKEVWLVEFYAPYILPSRPSDPPE